MCFVAAIPLTVAGKVFKVIIIILLVFQVMVGIGITTTGIYAFKALAPSYEAGNHSSLAADIALFTYIGDVKTFAQSRVAQACGLVTAIGIFLLVTGLYGLSAIINHNPKALLILLAALVLSSSISTGGAIVSAKWRSEAAYAMLEVMKWTLHTQYDGNLNSTNKWSRLWDLAQVSFDCCGIYNVTDYSTAVAFRAVYVGREFGLDPDVYLPPGAPRTPSGGFVKNLTCPITCCKLNVSMTAQVENVLKGAKSLFSLTGQQLLRDPRCPLQPDSQNSNINTGCLDKLMAMKEKYATLLEGLAGGTVGMQSLLMLLIIGIIFVSLPS